MRLRVDSRLNRLLWDTVGVDERIPFLQLLGAGNYNLIGGTCNHHGPGAGGECSIPDNNHWADSSVIANLQRIATSWQSKFPTEQVLNINDMSLRFGGEFDVYGNWASPHQSHRKGDDVDIRTDLFFYDTTTHQLKHRIGVPVRSPRTEPFNTVDGSINPQSRLTGNTEFGRFCRENGGTADIHFSNTTNEHYHIDFDRGAR